MQDQREQVVAAVCERALGATPATVRDLPTGNSKRTALVTLDDGREVVVQYRGRERSLAAEAAVTRAVAARTDVPVAPVLGTGTVEDLGVTYLVTEHVAGDDLHERFAGLGPEHRSVLARTLGRCLAAVHDAFAFDAPGRVAGTDDGDALGVPEPLPAGAFYREYLDRALADWPGALAALEPRVETALGDRLDELPADEARLFPWDYRPGNVIVQGGAGPAGGDGSLGADDPPEVAAVLDWDEPLAAHPGLSVAKAEFTLCDWYVRSEADVRALREAYRAGYREVRPYPDDAADAFRLLGIVASAADSRGEVTRPRYPIVDADAAVAFHRERIEAVLERLG
ncbi:phosphotransferase family protein [Haloglomus litoreum]|uniref:phosphotransferase family protein n=1 Tax=Haloglomus litoreum TaxID=3034026 RepID=UPI0023E7C216|nr:phosphotransferase [Haloglomus sp. DT116]